MQSYTWSDLFSLVDTITASDCVSLFLLLLAQLVTTAHEQCAMIVDASWKLDICHFQQGVAGERVRQYSYFGWGPPLGWSRGHVRAEAVSGLDHNIWRRCPELYITRGRVFMLRSGDNGAVCTRIQFPRSPRQSSGHFPKHKIMHGVVRPLTYLYLPGIK